MKFPSFVARLKSCDLNCGYLVDLLYCSKKSISRQSRRCSSNRLRVSGSKSGSPIFQTTNLAVHCIHERQISLRSSVLWGVSQASRERSLSYWVISRSSYLAFMTFSIHLNRLSSSDSNCLEAIFAFSIISRNRNFTICISHFGSP